jgi:hypothetical protein
MLRNRMARMVVVIGALGAAACGGSGESGGTGATSASTSSTSGSGGSGDGGAHPTCQEACIAAHESGYVVLQKAALAACGCTSGGSCAAACAGNVGCTSQGAAPTGECHACLQMLVPTDACVVMAAIQGTCPADTDCAALAACFVAC